jgi:arginine decarboxylase
LSTNHTNIQNARNTYGIDSWGSGYFGISAQGRVVVNPFGTEACSVDLAPIVARAHSRKLQTPLIVRFPQILETQMNRLQGAFSQAATECNYQGYAQCVFPFKVNQRREFIDALVGSGRPLKYGLEVGTKAELFAALSYELHPEALFVCNGFKDSSFIQLAFDAERMGKNVVLVVEGKDELKYILEYASQVGFCVKIGLRAKLYAKGSGLWAKSSGAESKFGLSTVEMMESLSLISDAGLSDHLAMLHYHIGSQITEIKKVKNAMKEAGRVYSKMIKLGFGLRYLNIGGGIGVDYDGSKTSFYASANYNLQEFANDVVYIIKEVCESEKVPPPVIVSESGRTVAAYHAVLVTDVREVEQMGGEVSEIEISAEDHKILRELKFAHDEMNSKNFVEYYHDALEYRDELFTLFNLGYLELSARAKAETLFHEICEKALYYHALAGVPIEEFEELSKGRLSKYLANFSIFQSIPDSWSIEQLFPVMPLERHEEKYSRKGVVMDITCDSDGCLDQFVDQHDVKKSLELHVPHADVPYYIGFFLVGAYQEALGNNHNLFGATHEVIVTVDKETGKLNETDVLGEDVGEILRAMNYSDEEILAGYRHQLSQKLEQGKITPAVQADILHRVKSFFTEYPYLRVKRRLEIID